MSRVFTLMGQDLSAYVEDWGTIEETKDILLTTKQVFSGEMVIVLGDGLGNLSPGAAFSVFSKRNWFNQAGTVLLDGTTVFQGILKDVLSDHDNRTLSLKFENLFSRPSEYAVDRVSSTSENPALMLLDLFQKAGLADFVDTDSFNVAAGPSLAANATVLANYADQNKAPLLDVVKTISELCGISVFVRGGLIRAQAFRPYTGGGLGPELNPSTVRTFGAKASAFTSLYTGCRVAYSTNALVLEDPAALLLNDGISKLMDFQTGSDSSLRVFDLISATFFAQQFNERAARLKDTISLEVGADQFPNIGIGERYPVTAPYWGYSSEPFEVIETRRAIKETAIELTLASLNL